MSSEALDKFLGDLAKNPTLREGFARKVARFAHSAGYLNVSEQDVRTHFEGAAQEKPAAARETAHSVQRAHDWDEIYGPK